MRGFFAALRMTTLVDGVTLMPALEVPAYLKG